jgi:hypothetical protein
MRSSLGLLFAITVVVLCGAGEGEAACRAAGDYRVTGPNAVGFATLEERSAGEAASSGTVLLLAAVLLILGGCAWPAGMAPSEPPALDVIFVVSHQFDMGDWVPERSFEVAVAGASRRVFLWRIPARP